MEETRVDSRAAWKTAWLVLAILSVSYGSPLLIVVGMKPIQESLMSRSSVRRYPCQGCESLAEGPPSHQ